MLSWKGMTRWYSTISSTIYAVSSGKGKCGVSVIRVSGPNASEAIDKMIKTKDFPKARTAVLSKICDPITAEELDRGLVLWFPGPKSFTGEDCCEFQVHGGHAVVTGVLNALSKLKNFRHAEAGEFTKRAFHAGKLDLTEVEGLADLIHAETEMQRKQAFLQMDGALSQLYLSWRQRILKNVAHVEAFIDFSEEENIEDNILETVNSNLQNLLHDIENHLNDERRGERLRDGIKAVIVGEPNVGKSSLLNILCQRPAAIVTSIAGTTRDIIELPLNIGGYPVVIADTAGLRAKSQDEVEIEGIRRAKVHAKGADLRIIVIDIVNYFKWFERNNDHSFSDYLHEYLEELSLEEMEGSKQENVIVLNKLDLVDSERHKNLVKGIFETNLNVLPVSCTTNEGVENFTHKLAEVASTLCAEPSRESPTITQARHRQHVIQCYETLQKYFTLIKSESDVALAAQQLRNALRHIGKITGHVSTEQILDVIFKEFCIGK